MTAETMLTMLKIELMISPSNTAYNDYLTGKLNAAKAFIIREGASTLSPETSVEDAQLVIGYAAFLHRQKSEADAQLPRWLRWALNNRIFSEKMRDDA